jgi:hypothetical protein
MDRSRIDAVSSIAAAAMIQAERDLPPEDLAVYGAALARGVVRFLASRGLEEEAWSFLWDDMEEHADVSARE